MTYVLASASPRRREILSGLGVTFHIELSQADEHCDAEDPAKFVRTLALRKGDATRKKLVGEGRMTDETVILSADTVVALDGRILGKPSSEEDARKMLKSLSGREHTVLTGIALTDARGASSSVCITRVRFDKIPEDELISYLESAEPYDKAGAYGIQGTASRWVSGIDGCYFNVVGLPVHALCQLHKERYGIPL